MIKILANDGIDKEGKRILEEAGFQVDTEKIPQEKLASVLNEKKYSALLVRSATQVRKELIDKCPDLKLVGRAGVGTDNIDVEYAKKKGMEIINTPSASSESVAELVIAHLFSLVRSLHLSNREMPMRMHGYAKENSSFNDLKKKFSEGRELRGKTLGIIGIGRIGQAVARIALGIGIKVIAHDPFVSEVSIDIEINGGKNSVPIKTISFEDVLKNSDFITLHVPGGNLIGEKEFAWMKNGAGIINASRGGVINENDLLKALDSEKISFAGLDVFENEPNVNQKILSHPRISVSPHIGASTREAQERIGIELAERVVAFFKAKK